MIYTFYSYKGGVGRSMALANVAVWLYRRGARVLVLDADLEAPGIEQFFLRNPADVARAQNTQGFLDLLLTYRRLFRRAISGEAAEIFEAARDRIPSLTEFLFEVAPASTSTGALHVMGGGRRGPDGFVTFANAVQDFDWSEFYRDYQGQAFFDWLRDTLSAMSDVVLIDSRTGVTEMGGVCTRHLADVVVAFSAANQQNLTGTIMMLESFRRAEILHARDGKPEVVIVPSRVESAELDNRERFKRSIQKRESDPATDFRPPAFRSLDRSFWDLCIPYVPRFSFDEALTFDGLPDANVIKADELETAYRRLAAHLVLLAAPDSALRKYAAADLQQFVPSPQPSAAARDTLWRSVFIAYARPDGERLAEVVDRSCRSPRRRWSCSSRSPAVRTRPTRAACRIPSSRSSSS